MSRALRLHIILPVAPSAVYQAITNSSSLQKWLTEMARVSLADGVFEPWGRYLPGAPDRPATKLNEIINSLKSMVEIGDSWQAVQVEESD